MNYICGGRLCLFIFIFLPDRCGGKHGCTHRCDGYHQESHRVVHRQVCFIVGSKYYELVFNVYMLHHSINWGQIETPDGDDPSQWWKWTRGREGTVSFPESRSSSITYLHGRLFFFFCSSCALSSRSPKESPTSSEIFWSRASPWNSEVNSQVSRVNS